MPTDDDGRVTAFLEKTPNPVTNRINAGCYVFTRSVIDQIPRDEVVSVERETFPGLIESGRLVLGYADRHLLARRRHARRVRRGLARPGARPPGLARTAGAQRANTSPCPARSCRRRPRSRAARRWAPAPSVEAGATVIGSVLSDDCVIESGAIVTDSVVGRGARVCAGTVVRDAVIGDGAVVGPGNELQAGVRIWPGVELPERAVRYSSDV